MLQNGWHTKINTENIRHFSHLENFVNQLGKKKEYILQNILRYFSHKKKSLSISKDLSQLTRSFCQAKVSWYSLQVFIYLFMTAILKASLPFYQVSLYIFSCNWERNQVPSEFNIKHSSGYFPILLVMYCWTTYNDASAWLVNAKFVKIYNYFLLNSIIK